MSVAESRARKANEGEQSASNDYRGRSKFLYFGSSSPAPP